MFSSKRIFGDTEESAITSFAILISLLLYILFSAYIRSELGEAEYRLWVLQEYARRFGLHPKLPAVEAGGILIVGLWATLCAISAYWLSGAGGQPIRSRTPQLIAWSLAVALTPALVIALLVWPDGRGILSTGVLLTVHAAIAAVAFFVSHKHIGRGETTTASDAVSTPTVVSRLAMYFFTIAMAMLVLAVFWCGASAVQGFDSWSYHIPLSARWLTDARFTRGMEATLTDFYPGNFEFLGRWILLFGSPRYVFIVSLCAGIACIYMLYRICRELNQSRIAALVAAASAATCVVFSNLATSSYSDLLATLGILLAIFFLMQWIRDHRRWQLISLGFGLAIAIGTKYTALPAMVTVLVILLFHWFRRDSYRTPTNTSAMRLFVYDSACVIAPLFLCAAYWYIRNSVQHGNPVFPVSMFGLHGVAMDYLVPPKPGLPEPGIQRLLFPWTEFGFGRAYYDDGIGIMFAGVALPGLLLLPIISPQMRQPQVAVWIITLVTLVYWASTGSLYARFGLIPIVLAFIFVGEMWDAVPSFLSRGVISVALGVAMTLLVFQLLSTAAYSHLLPPGRKGVPSVVDGLPAAAILNGVNAELTLPLMGRDYRHVVTTYFRDLTPNDVPVARPDLLLVRSSQLAAFASRGTPIAVDSSPVYGKMVLLKIGGPHENGQ